MFERRFAYRLTRWPELDPAERTAHVLRAFSRMTLGPVTSAWFLENSRLQPEAAGVLLQRLAAAGALERIDFGHAGDGQACPPPAVPLQRSRARAVLARGCAAAALVLLAALSSEDGSAAARAQQRIAAANAA